MSVGLDIMFLAIRTSCSLAVRAMRACAQGRSRSACPWAGSGGGHRLVQSGREVCGETRFFELTRQSQNPIRFCSLTRPTGHLRRRVESFQLGKHTRTEPRLISIQNRENTIFSLHPLLRFDNCLSGDLALLRDKLVVES